MRIESIYWLEWRWLSSLCRPDGASSPHAQTAADPYRSFARCADRGDILAARGLAAGIVLVNPSPSRGIWPDLRSSRVLGTTFLPRIFRNDATALTLSEATAMFLERFTRKSGWRFSTRSSANRIASFAKLYGLLIQPPRRVSTTKRQGALYSFSLAAGIEHTSPSPNLDGNKLLPQSDVGCRLVPLKSIVGFLPDSLV